MKSFRAFILTLGLLLAVPAVQAFDLRPIIAYQWYSLNGYVQDGNAKLDLGRDLGIGDVSATVAGIRIGLLGQRFDFRHVPYNFSGRRSLTRDIDFAGQYFSSGEDIHSRIKMNEYALDYRFVPLNTPIGHLGAGFGINQFEGSVTMISDADEGRSQGTVTIPTLGVTAGVNLPFTGLSLAADVSGMNFGKHRYSNVELQLDYKPYVMMGISVGYRKHELVLDSSDLELDLSMSGPFAAVWIGF